jgi:Rab GTPase-binding effector protein 1
LSSLPHRQAQEDAEVLRSLVVPLEEEIKSLKEKLRSVHTELENTRKSDSTQTSVPPESALIGMLGPRRHLIEPPEGASALISISCEMCQNYERKLVNSEKLLDEEKQKCQNHEKSMERMREDLQKESALRRELETQWQEKREEHKDEVIKLKENLQKTATEMKEISASYAELKETVNQDLLKITEERERVYHHLKILQSDNDMLSGKYLAHSEFLKDQAINLPQDIEALHELVLGLHENLILAKVGQEYGEAKYKNFADEANLLRDQMQAHERDRMYIEKEMQQRIGGLEEKLRTQQDHFQKLAGHRDDLKRRDAELKKQNSDLRMQLIELTEAKEKQDKTIRELRVKETVLQQDLGNSEAVQQDFVRLSQSLQIQLEKIRSADTQVRWQDEDDANHCASCKKEFTVTRRKVSVYL